MSNNATLKQNQLEGRITRASKDLHIILRDLQRDCKPYWKFSELERELLDIAHEAGKLTQDHSRELNARRKLKRDILKLKAKVDERIKELERAECSSSAHSTTCLAGGDCSVKA